MNIPARTFVVLILLAGLGRSAPAQVELLQKEIAKIIRFEATIDFRSVPGILVGVIDGDSSYICSFGQQMDADSIYELGSVTKPVVAWLVDQALDSLGWTRDLSVCRFLPDSLCLEGWEQLKVDQVLHHRTGLSRLPAGIGELENNVQDPYVRYGESCLASDISLMKPVPDVYSYSHVAYALFYWLFEKVGGLESFTQQKLIEPLDLKNTEWNFPDEEIAAGYGLDGKPKLPWHCNALSPAFGLKASMRDLMTFLKYISPNLAKKTPALSSALKKELNILSKSGEYKVIGGWFLIRSGSSLVYYHTGRTGGHQVSIAFIPGSMKAVVVISNGTAGSNELCFRVLDMIMNAKNK